MDEDGLPDGWTSVAIGELEGVVGELKAVLTLLENGHSGT